VESVYLKKKLKASKRPSCSRYSEHRQQQQWNAIT